tara:strand:- start:7934 stop:11158 length:3225 start_codon:yes stop_codon:yes gene_type:complete
MSLLPSKSDIQRKHLEISHKVKLNTVEFPTKNLRKYVIEFISSPNCEEWQLSLVIWLFRFITKREKNAEDLKKYLKAALELILDQDKARTISIFSEVSKDEKNQSISALLLNCLNEIKKMHPGVQPSLENCLTPGEKKAIEDKLFDFQQKEYAEIDINSLDESPQLKVLEKYKHYSGFSKYIFQLNYLKEKVCEKETSNFTAKAALHYLLEKEDLVPDSTDLIGLIDDLYAISFTYKKLNPNKEFYKLVAKHDKHYSAFSFPGVGEGDLLPLTNLEDLVKACYTKEEQEFPLKRFVITREIGPLGLLVSLGKSLTDRFDASSRKNKVSSFISGDIINIGFKKSPSGKKRKINAKYIKRIGSNHLLKSKVSEIKVKEDDLKNASKLTEGASLSSEREIKSLLNPENKDNERYLWDELLFSKKIKRLESLGKILLISEKASLEPYLDQKMHGETIRSWFGLRGFKKDYTLEDEVPSPQQLFPEAQIILAVKDDQVYKALDLHENEIEDFNLALIVCAKSSLLEDETFRSRLYETPVDTIIFNEIYKNDISKSLETNKFKPLVGIQDEYQPIEDAIKKGGAFGSYLMRSLKPNIIIKEMKDDKKLEHLDKLRSFVKEFDDENLFLKLRFARIAHVLGQKLIPFDEEEEKNFEEKFHFFLEDLEVESRREYNLKKIYSYLKDNKEEIMNISRCMHIEKYLNEDKRVKHSIICRKSDQEKLKNYFEKKDFNLEIINKSELDSKGFFKNLIIPYFWGAEISTKLRNYHYAENHIFFFTKEEYRLHKKMEKRERKFFEKEQNTNNNEITFETSEEFDERVEQMDPWFSIKETTTKVVGKQFQGDVRENIPSNVFYLEGEKLYTSPRDGDCLSISKENNKIVYKKSSEINLGDKLVIAEKISGDDLLRAHMEQNKKNFSKYKEKEEQAKIWKKSLKNYKFKENLEFKDLREKLESAGVKRTIHTIKGWLNDPDTFRPRSLEDITKIFKLTGESHENTKKCIPSLNELRKLRDIAKDELNNILEAKKIEEDSKDIYVSLGTKNFNFSIYSIEATDKVEVARNNLYKVVSIDDLLITKINEQIT